MKIGDKLISLHQGVHRSSKSGVYNGNGEYKINMIDGGNGRSFSMSFQITSQGGSSYELRRTDCDDLPTILHDKRNGALIGGEYTLNFG